MFTNHIQTYDQPINPNSSIQYRHVDIYGDSATITYALKTCMPVAAAEYIEEKLNLDFSFSGVFNLHCADAAITALSYSTTCEADLPVFPEIDRSTDLFRSFMYIFST